jgi:hypothetical protein
MQQLPPMVVLVMEGTVRARTQEKMTTVALAAELIATATRHRFRLRLNLQRLLSPN